MADGSNSNSFVHVGRPACGIVIDLAARRNLWRALKGTVALLDDKPDPKTEARRLEVERGKALITKGIGLIQMNASPQDAIEFMRSTLAAIDGSTA